MYVVNETEIIICTRCKGEGTLLDKEQRGPIKTEKTIKCDTCIGSGRMLKTTHIKKVPFKPNTYEQNEKLGN